MRVIRAALLLAAACGAGSEPERQAVPASEQVAPLAPAAPRPAPGVDLDGPIPLPDVTGGARAPAAKVVDLMSDRAIVEVSLPEPPRGGAAQFTFADDRPGWIARIPDGAQLPSVAYGNGKVYVSGGFESVNFYALEAQTGSIAWAATALEDNGPTAAVIDGDDVLFNTESCTLFNLDGKTGKRNWYRYLGDPTLSQVAVKDGLVYAAYPGADGQYLGAYKVKTGVPVWSRFVGTELLATPVVAGDSIYASTIGGETYRLDHRNGRVKWRKHLRATTAPWIAGEELFVSRRHKGKEQQVVVAVADGKLLREHATSAGSYDGDVPVTLDSWKQVWAFEGSRPVVDRGIRYVAMGNEVHASDAQTGDLLWTRRYPGTADKRVLGSVAVAQSALVVSSHDGKLFGLDVDTGFTLWSYDIGKRIAAEPIIAKGWLYAATVDGYVVALDVADPSLDGWHMFGGNAQKNGPTVLPTAPPPVEGQQASAGTDSSVDAAIATSRAELERDETQRKELEQQRALEAEHERLRIEIRKRERTQPVKIQPACISNPLC